MGSEGTDSEVTPLSLCSRPCPQYMYNFIFLFIIDTILPVHLLLSSEAGLHCGLDQRCIHFLLSPDLGTRPLRTPCIPSGFLSSGFLMKKWEGGVGHTGSWPIGCTCMERKSQSLSLDQALGCPPLTTATTWMEAKKAERFPSLGSS